MRYCITKESSSINIDNKIETSSVPTINNLIMQIDQKQESIAISTMKKSTIIIIIMEMDDNDTIATGDDEMLGLSSLQTSYE